MTLRVGDWKTLEVLSGYMVLEYVCTSWNAVVDVLSSNINRSMFPILENVE